MRRTHCHLWTRSQYISGWTACWAQALALGCSLRQGKALNELVILLYSLALQKGLVWWIPSEQSVLAAETERSIWKIRLLCGHGRLSRTGTSVVTTYAIIVSFKDLIAEINVQH